MTPKKQITGRPLKFTVEEVHNMVDEYLKPGEGKHYTVSGLALLFGSKQLLNDYEGRKEYQPIIRRAKLMIEDLYEQNLTSPSCTGSIFALKNFGWKDKQEVEHSGEVKQSISVTVVSGKAKQAIEDLANGEN